MVVRQGLDVIMYMLIRGQVISLGEACSDIINNIDVMTYVVLTHARLLMNCQIIELIDSKNWPTSQMILGCLVIRLAIFWQVSAL